MSKDVTFNLNDVISDLGVDVANLKIQLAKEKRAKQAYMKRVEELEEEIELNNKEENIKEETEDESNDN